MNVQRTLLTKMLAGKGLFQQQRAFSSVAYNVKSKFEAAYTEKMASLGNVTTKG
jgi:hypothetical protein